LHGEWYSSNIQQLLEMRRSVVGRGHFWKFTWDSSLHAGAACLLAILIHRNVTLSQAYASLSLRGNLLLLRNPFLQRIQKWSDHVEFVGISNR
jgi:hypothetical protein